MRPGTGPNTGEQTWTGQDRSQASGAPVGLHTNGFSAQGWFVGGGVENNLDIFGLSAPGWFMKTEYRAAYYGLPVLASLLKDWQ